ncbi:MAG: patatin-like phospholipase family protein [Pseudomonadales bacterium]|nr:patatin-like phospholipase family protein [Pseudomonadales bacterium]
MMSPILSSVSLYAGPTAARHIRAHGFRQQDFTTLVGASGGPKWFVLYGLDRFLSAEFFAGRTQPLELFGSSAGAWRLACMAHPEPVKAITALALNYSRQCYSAQPSLAEISTEAEGLLTRMIGEASLDFLTEHPVFSLRIFADRCRGLLQSEHSLLLGSGLALCGAANLVSRKTLPWFFERTVFHGGSAELKKANFLDMPTQFVRLRSGNLKAALMASGSIPLVMRGVTGIEAAAGVYRDGGMTDYHFNLPFHRQKGLVLYPHFYPQVIPGWFDKSLPWRRADQSHFDNVLMVVPSAEFVRRLPYGKIPDRKDFQRMDDESRLKYWRQVLHESERLADEFAALIADGSGVDRLQNLRFGGWR